MKTKLVTLFVEPSRYEQIRIRAFQERVSVSEIIRRAMAAYLAAKDKGSRKS